MWPLRRKRLDLRASVLGSIETLVADVDLDDEDVLFRGRQLVECAGGTLCPEVAFDPVARLVFRIALGGEEAWPATVEAAVRSAFARRRLPASVAA